MKSSNSKPSTQPNSDSSWLIVIATVSVVVPLLVAWLLYGKRETGLDGTAGNWNFLPALNAGINGSVAILLLIGKFVIRQDRRQLHKRIMLSALGLSVLFLVSYILYHAQAGDVRYKGEGADRYFYLFILITHILLSIVVVPLALLAVYRGLKGQFESHKKVVKWTWPIWVYVSVTGVLVYLFAHILNPV
jgi:putative membrane protein